jgi:cobalt/nickel transport system permease protein
MLFVNSFERAHRIYRAMLCRGFGGEFRTIDHFVLGRFDVLFLLVQVFVVLVIITVQVLS